MKWYKKRETWYEHEEQKRQKKFIRKEIFCSKRGLGWPRNELNEIKTNEFTKFTVQKRRKIRIRKKWKRKINNKDNTVYLSAEMQQKGELL
jgi:hypothetical protein